MGKEDKEKQCKSLVCLFWGKSSDQLPKLEFCLRWGSLCPGHGLGNSTDDKQASLCSLSASQSTCIINHGQKNSYSPSCLGWASFQQSSSLSCKKVLKSTTVLLQYSFSTTLLKASTSRHIDPVPGEASNSQPAGWLQITSPL